MEFWKGQALGNDYLVVDRSGADAPKRPLIRSLCDRHRGVGGDGVLVANLSADPVALRIFNPDGGEAEKSGNGLRIFGAWLHATGRVAHEAFQVALPEETVEMRVVSAGEDGTRTVEVDMGTASFGAGAVGLSAGGPEGAGSDDVGSERHGVRIHLVDVGNPHCVVFLDEGDDGESAIRRLGPTLQADSAFTRGINVQAARIADAGAMEAWIWERGAGETMASGSSACAVAAAAVRTGRVDGPDVEVRMPGGAVQVRVAGQPPRLTLTGAAQIVFRGEIDPAVLAGWQDSAADGAHPPTGLSR